MPMNGVMTMSGIFSQLKKKEWAIRFVALMERYQNIVKGIFYGHNHEDAFTLLHSLKDPKKFFKVGILNPSLGTFTNNNPAFRIFYINKDTYEIMDHETYRLYINEANILNKTEWKLAYKFTEYYGYPSPNLESYLDLKDKVKTNRTVGLQYLKMRAAEGGAWQHKIDDPDFMRSTLCKMVTATLQEQEDCYGRSSHTSIVDKIRYFVADMFTALEWNYLKY